MGTFYEQVRRVTAWLGTAADHSDLAFQQFPTCAERFQAIAAEGADILPSMGIPNQEDPVWPAVFKIFGRPWFRRLWVIQEAVLAINMILLCGSRVIR